MQPPHPAMSARPRSAFEEEFDVIKEMQMNRMAFRESQICNARCVSNYMFNNFYLNEKACMNNCLELLNQVAVIANISQAQFEEQRQKGLKK